MKKILGFMIALVFIAAVAGAVFALQERLPRGIERRAADFEDRHVVFDVVDLTAGQYVFTLMSEPTDPKSVREWREETGADLVFNGAYFNDANEATGFYRLNGGESVAAWPALNEQKESASYSFLVEETGGQLLLSYLPQSPRETPPETGFLSFPTLVVDGESLVTADTGLRASRTMIARGANGHVYLIITEKGSLSLFEAAQWLSEQPEAFVIAGNLDGGPSTGMSMIDGKRVFEQYSSAVPNVVVGQR